MEQRAEEIGALPEFREDRGLLLPVFWTADGKAVTNRLEPQLGVAGANWLRVAISRIDTRCRLNESTHLVPRRDSSYIAEEVEFPNIIGRSMVVPTVPGDEIRYGLRPRRGRPSRLVNRKEPIPSKHYTVILLAKEEQPEEYLLIAGCIGRRMEIEPCDYMRLYSLPLTKVNRKHIRERSRAYWESHAFVMDEIRYWPQSLKDKPPDNWFSAPIPRWARWRFEQGGQHGSSDPDMPLV